MQLVRAFQTKEKNIVQYMLSKKKKNLVEYVQWVKMNVSYVLRTRPETICPSTSKLACWRVQLSTASKVERRDNNRQH
jgi:hypothetical protein